MKLYIYYFYLLYLFEPSRMTKYYDIKILIFGQLNKN